MGSRGRSIRLRIYFLVAIPLIAMVGLLAYVVATSVNNAVSVDRVPNLINASGIPAAKFGVFVESERAAAVVYLFEPAKANLAAYRTAVTATNKAEPAFTAAMTSPAVVGTESSSGAAQIRDIFGGLGQLPALRSAIQARGISPLAALAAYSQGLAATTKLFLIQTDSVVATDQLGPAVGLIATVQAREQLSQEYALLTGMLAGHRTTLADRVAFTNMAAARQANLQDADNLLGPADLAAYNAPKAGSGAMQQDLTSIEQAIAAGTPVSKLPVTAAQWQATAGTLLTDYFNGGVAVANAILVADHQISHAAWVRVAVVSCVGLLGLLITILVTTLVARGIIRRLGGLERNALQLAEVQLPDVVARLRRGDDVDVNAEAPGLRVGADEIGRVGKAFELVRQTAIRSAVEEAKLRRGLNDVFRSLARRSQSLLHRQLTLLDQMERRATDPEALDDLFRLDHLTTRMRRHAEGLVILAGAPPGRAWSSPVPDGGRDARRHRRGRGLRPGLGGHPEPGRAGRFRRGRRHPFAGRAHRERHHPVAAVHVGSRVRGHGGQRVRDRGGGPRAGDEPAAAGRAQRAAGQPAGVQPVRQRAARPVRGQPAGQAARHPGHAQGVPVRGHGGHRAHPGPPGGYRGSVPGRAPRRARGDRHGRGFGHQREAPRHGTGGPARVPAQRAATGRPGAPGGSRTPHLGAAAAAAGRHPGERQPRLARRGPAR